MHTRTGMPNLPRASPRVASAGSAVSRTAEGRRRLAGTANFACWPQPMAPKRSACSHRSGPTWSSLDLILPWVNGIEVLRTVRDHPQLRIVEVLVLRTASPRSRAAFNRGVRMALARWDQSGRSL